MRTRFLTIAGALGVLIGLVALFLPNVILASKGVAPAPAPAVWVREVGVLIVATSFIALLVRRHPDSATLRAVLWGNAAVHVGLLPIEILALQAGVITRFDGIAPNSVLHVLFAASFALFALRIREPVSALGEPRPHRDVAVHETR